MVEQVARAIAHAQLTRQYVGKLKNIGAVIEIDRIWPEFVPEALAAIEAVRSELTPSMIEAGVARYLELRDAPVLRSFLVSEVISAALGPDFVIVDNRYRSAARAAIEELRVPTDAMIAAGRKASGILVDASSSAGGPRWCELPDDEIRKAFDAMMATALDAHK